MDLTVTKLYQTIKDPDVSARDLWKACDAFINSKKNINITDSNTGQTFLHVLTGHGGHVVKPNGVPVVYLMAISGVDVNARDHNGDTCLHKAARASKSYRVVEALIRCVSIFPDKHGKLKYVA